MPKIIAQNNNSVRTSTNNLNLILNKYTFILFEPSFLHYELLYYLIFPYTVTTKERRGVGGLGGARAKTKTNKHVNIIHYHTTVKKF